VKMLIILSVTVLSSCCSIPDQAKLPLPPDLVYPKIQAEELQCLSDDTYKRLNERRIMCESRIETLKNTIKKTHK
jgi:hypothetical protein